jgi:DNA polymerase-1
LTTLIVDGDLFAYRVAAATERATDFGDGQYALTADADAGKFNLDATMDDFMTRLGGERMIVAISDEKNFRKEVMPTYKSNRANVRRPIILHALLDHFRENYEVFVRPHLEADDVMGILATNPKVVEGEKIVITMDKDLRSVPGLHWNPEKEGLTKRQEPTKVSLAAADAAFYRQVLSGDMVDGYSGCPGIGTKRAAELVDQPIRKVQTTFEVKRGPNKGQLKSRWLSEPTADIWECIITHYVAAGLTEEDAITTARVARILRHGDYDYKRKEPILWQPSR